MGGDARRGAVAVLRAALVFLWLSATNKEQQGSQFRKATNRKGIANPWVRLELSPSPPAASRQCGLAWQRGTDSAFLLALPATVRHKQHQSPSRPGPAGAVGRDQTRRCLKLDKMNNQCRKF